MDNCPIKPPLLLDGGTASGLRNLGYNYNLLMEKWVLDNPEKLVALQKSFVDAGSEVLYTATFSANEAILSNHGLNENECEKINREIAKITYDNFKGKALIAGDISPTGLMVEPYGDTTFTELIAIYDKQVKALSDYVDLFTIETMTTLWDMRAAVIACKRENKPVFVTLCANEHGETPSGTSVKSALIILQELGISAFGINCSDADVCLDIIRDIAPFAKIPLIAKPYAEFINNNNETITIAPQAFAEKCKLLLENGVTILGGCCGATCEHIAMLKKLMDGFDFNQVSIEKQETGLVFATENQIFFLEPDTTEISPPINCLPDMIDVLTEACEDSYDVICVEINSPDDAIDFAKNMHMATLPVMFTSDDKLSLKMALMLYQGRALIDSKCTIEQERLERIAAKYGAVIY